VVTETNPYEMAAGRDEKGRWKIIQRHTQSVPIGREEKYGQQGGANGTTGW